MTNLVNRVGGFFRNRTFRTLLPAIAVMAIGVLTTVVRADPLEITITDPIGVPALATKVLAAGAIIICAVIGVGFAFTLAKKAYAMFKRAV